MERVPCFVSVDFIVLNVLRSSSYCCGYARFVLRLVKDGREGGSIGKCGMCTITSLTVVISCSMSRCQLAHT